MTINTSTVVSWQKALIVCSSPLDTKQWLSTNAPGGNASSVSLPIAYRQWYKIVATGVVDSSDGDFKQTVAVLRDYNWSMTSFALRTSGSDRPAAFCITIGV